MKNRILVLNLEVSGMNKYLFFQLRKRGWDLSIAEVPYYKRYKWQALISAFCPHIGLWRKRFNERLSKLYKSPGAFLSRTKYCQNIINRCGEKADIIFQISGMFAPYTHYNGFKGTGGRRKNYALMLSYTMALSRKYSRWSAFPAELDRWMKLENELYKNAAIIFSTNENAVKSLITDYEVEKEKVVKVGYGVKMDNLPDAPKSYDAKTILFVGIDFERKGGYVLLEAFERVRKAIPEARLLIAGPNQSAVGNKQQGIEAFGLIRNKQILNNLYQRASIFVMPSLCEPFGLVFLEAMAHRLPCVGTAVDAIPEIIEDGRTGFLVGSGDAEGLAEKIIALLNNPAQLKSMGAQAYQKVWERFSWDKVGERIDSGLRSILAQ